MDQRAKVHEASDWEPKIGMGGRVEIAVSYYDDTIGRVVFQGISLKQYLELWDKKALRFQEDGAIKPSHLPTREEAAAEQEKEEERLHAATLASSVATNEESFYKPSSKKSDRPMPDLPPDPAPQLLKQEPQPTKVIQKAQRDQKVPPAALQPLEWNLEACVTAFGKRTWREQEILRAIASERQVRGLSQESAKAIFSKLVTLMGAPKNSPRFNRKEAVQKVIASYDSKRSLKPKDAKVAEPQKKPEVKKTGPKSVPLPPKEKVAVSKTKADPATLQMIYAEYRRAAEVIRGKNSQVTFGTLAEQLNLKRSFVESFLYQNNSLKNELLGSAK